LEGWNVGILEYWAENRNVAHFGNIKMPMALMKLVAVRNPSFHHSTIPLSPSNNLLA